ncbi:hypothetical protein CH373_10480 [Leptospira perolatii]|uniref:SbsA Ig-like domain-containing protein n=1 Tax=Leptospira perolatii TaxID=2023191 RepID=A0A2M9ZMS4_9LEPT|nr:Ig-like domain-containing protein [Leptospira perolatii]PJZ68273.1 hypothetical protein CH360_16990 [Leptospira perolatii]PJZ73376.1 hypothetical protein CH373_10480 [Leptospira perolatii]
MDSNQKFGFISFLLRIRYLVFIGMFVCLQTSCSQLLDNAKGPLDFLPNVDVLPDSNPPKVIYSLPVSGSSGVNPNTEIVIAFSKSMNKDFTESGFSLSNNGQTVDGVFHWMENMMSFKPFKPLTSPGLYTYAISKLRAESSEGVNLLDDLRINFSYNSDLSPPKVVQTIPANGSSGIAPNTLITVIFDKPIEVPTLFSSISTRPNVDLDFGSARVLSGGMGFEFRPAADLSYGTIYTVTIPTTVKDTFGNSLVQPYTFSFTVGNDFVPPDLSSIEFKETPTIVSKTLDLTREFEVQNDVNKTDFMEITFNEPIQMSSLLDGVRISPAVPFTVTDTAGTRTTFQIRFSEPLSVDSVYNLNITTAILDDQKNKLRKNYTFYFKVNGTTSRKIKVLNVFSDAGLSTPLLINQINTGAPQLTVGTCNATECDQSLFIRFCYPDPLSPTSCTNLPGVAGSTIQLSSVDVRIQKEFGTSIGSCLEYADNASDVTPAGEAPNHVVFSSSARCLDRSSTYLIRIKGGSSGVTDNYGNLMDDDYTFRVRFP